MDLCKSANQLRLDTPTYSPDGSRTAFTNGPPIGAEVRVLIEI
ncbi:MAG TPA: hypothetical protein VMR52_09810 [Dehalococcoidia bacterium]|nr:hypothetical protein [Dehalococcoidia bacterium]